ncbi:MAG: hypothetical protein GEV28_08770 [Actinophytocola sp.]|uniref:hypothetical protein n=1 Tax=Actinophytocola sp. TaxID=1872138 RepID=UPI0013249903|nr:hypothetical protein [Actinophytocola sp.]MPZ80470.1 hypothetical protein [Actinophytocola sp.]
MPEPIPVDALRRAAQLPGAPARLTNVADGVLEGRFTWAEVASGRCSHPLAQALYTPRAQRLLAPILEHLVRTREVPEVPADPAPIPGPSPRRRAATDDRDFSDDDNVRHDVFETPGEVRRPPPIRRR